MYVVAVQIHSAHSARPPFKSYAAWRDESSGFFGPFQRNSAHGDRHGNTNSLVNPARRTQ
jgi:hypothetical protein